jgi:hypothetical protein
VLVYAVAAVVLSLRREQMSLKGITEGRWLTPDPLGGNITNPQSLNRYAYALNNPTSMTDPSGLSPCDQSNPANSRVLNFIKANQAAAEKLAVSLGCPAQDILGLSAEESAYGTSPVAQNAHNFFGLHAGAPGATGTYTTSGGVAVSSFPAASGFLSSGQSFGNLYGNVVSGAVSGTAFAQALVKAGFNTANPGFTSLVAGTIASIQSRWNCPQLKSVQSVPTKPASGGGGGGGAGGGSGMAGAGYLGAPPAGWNEFEWLELLSGELGGTPVVTTTIIYGGGGGGDSGGGEGDLEDAGPRRMFPRCP